MYAEITGVLAREGENFLSRWKIRSNSVFGSLATVLLLMIVTDVFANDVSEYAVQQQLRDLLSNVAAPNTAPQDESAIQKFYVARNHVPAWVKTARLMEIEGLGQLARVHGLNPDDYHLAELRHRVEQLKYAGSAQELAKLEILATYSIARLASHLSLGKVDMLGRYAELRTVPAPLSTQVLTDAARSASLYAYLDSLAPDTLLYRKLQWSLARHRALLQKDTEWEFIPDGRTLEIGMTDPRVPLLRRRLGMVDRENSSDLYDAELAQAVAEFQSRHLLNSDGLLGKRTIGALNISIQERIDQLRVNLDWQRWAAMPDQSEYVLVNIAHYKMHWIQSDERIWSTRTQVGKRKRPTPAFKSTVTAIMANPTWTVPPTIFREDLLPQLQADSNTLQYRRMHVVDQSGQLVDSQLIDWQQTNAADFAYRLRARPGGDNPLGRMKFLTPNPYLIYLHDTPSQHLFENETRAFSSGCIRVQNPEKLAAFLMERQPANERGRLHDALAGKRSRYIGLEHDTPIVVMYGTVDLNADHELVFARDIYKKDRRVLAALDVVEGLDRDMVLAALAPLTTL
jgi:murein L,D-transpeptidase YcbB/YkuD